MPKKWILIVDDDPSILTIVCEALEHPKLRLTTAADATQAFVQARDLKPSVIISDILMPGCNGTEIFKQLREDANIPRMPIIFISGMDPAKARELLPPSDPSVSLVQKPFDLPALRDRVWDLAGLNEVLPPAGW